MPLSGGGKLILRRSSPGMSHRREHFLLQLGRFRCSGASRSNSKNQFARLPSSAAVSGYASVRPLPPSGLAWIGLTGRYWSSEESAMPRSTCTTGGMEYGKATWRTCSRSSAEVSIAYQRDAVSCLSLPIIRRGPRKTSAIAHCSTRRERPSESRVLPTELASPAFTQIWLPGKYTRNHAGLVSVIVRQGSQPEKCSIVTSSSTCTMNSIC